MSQIIEKIIDKVANNNKIDRRVVEQILMSECRTIEDSMSKGKEVLLRYFGKFWIKNTIKYRVRNGESLEKIKEEYVNRGKVHNPRMVEPDMEG